MSPLPGWNVIPPNWSEHHRPVVEGTLTAECTILRDVDGPPPYPRPPGWVAQETLWTGQCRLQELKRENSTTPGLQPTETRQYLIVLPFQSAQGVALPVLRTGERGDVVRVANRDFNLKQSMAGSELWENDFIAVENQTQQAA